MSWSFNWIIVLVWLVGYGLAAPLELDALSLNIESMQITTNGTGCPQNSSLNVLPNANQTSFSMLFDTFFASLVSNETTILEDNLRKECTIRLSFNLSRPASAQYMLERMDYKGFVNLDQGLMAVMSSQYQWNGRPLAPANVTSATTEGSVQSSIRSSRFRGPLLSDYRIRHSFDFSQQEAIWSRCSQQSFDITMDHQLFIRRINQTDTSSTRNSTFIGAGLVQLDSMDGAGQVTLRQRPCRFF